MCSRWAISARDSPCRSRSRAIASPRLTGRWVSSTDSTGLLLLLELAQLRRIRVAPAQLLHHAVLGDLVVVAPRDVDAEHQRFAARLREAHVAQQVGLRVLVGAAL